MVNSHSLDAAFSALSDPSRRAILARLARSERTVGELAEPLPMSLPAVSKHLRILEQAGLVAASREGRTRRIRLVPAALAPAQDWIARHRAFWEESLDALALYLERARASKEPTEKSPDPPARTSRPARSPTPRRPLPSLARARAGPGTLRRKSSPARQPR